MAITGLCFLNLPWEINEEQFRKEISCIWPVIRKAQEENRLHVQLFKKDSRKRKGVVSGFQKTSFQMMEAVGRKHKLWGRNICIKPDVGEARDEFGEFLVKSTVLAKRERNKIHGIFHNKVFVAFQPEIVQEMGRRIVEKKTLTINPKLPDEVIGLAGTFTHIPIDGIPLGAACVRFSTCLETIQAICLLCNNKQLCCPVPKIGSPFDSDLCKTNVAAGIGKTSPDNSTIVNILDITKKSRGYVPFECLNKDWLVDTEALTALQSLCWRCGTGYKLLGVALDLGFIAGRCACSYSDLLHEEQRQAYMWDNEDFSRLGLGELNHDKREYAKLHILHNPMRTQYTNPEEYANVVLPILEEEWKVSSLQFKEQHTTTAQLCKLRLVETITVKRKGKEKKRTIYALDLKVPRSKLWCCAKRSGLKQIYLPFELEDGDKNWTIRENHKGKIRNIEEVGENLYLRVQAMYQLGKRPRFPQTVTISAKANKLPYVSTRRAIKKWMENESIDTSCPYLRHLLNPLNYEVWGMVDVEWEDDEWDWGNRLHELTSTLNASQKKSLDEALTHSLSFIQGPPGTGKTYNAAVLCIYLALKEVGNVVACAPSNEAADNLAQQIQDLLAYYRFPRNVLRVESKSREEADWEEWWSNGKKMSKKTYSLLHEEVFVKMEAGMDASVAKAYEARKGKYSHLLKKHEREALGNEVGRIEKSVSGLFCIHIYTLSTLGDGRAKSFSKMTPITTIIVDEAGQATQPSLIYLAALAPARLILTGDHLQLQPVVESFSARDAGLNKSHMEFSSSVFLGDKRHIRPWTMLDVQFRMVPAIRNLVSEVSYMGKLVDDPSVCSRSSQLPDCMKDKSPLVLINHKFPESKVKNSYRNDEEAQLIASFVRHLIMEKGVKQDKITILTLYEAQKEEIIRILKDIPEFNLERLRVFNVDAFQGRENAVVIISLVRSNLEGKLGFTRVPNRLNVAISRAREMLVVAGNIDTFRTLDTKLFQTFVNIITNNATHY